MCAPKRRQMEWVLRNRTRRPRYRPIGALMQAMANRLTCEVRSDLADLASVLPDLVDEEFCRCCRVAAFERGVLRLHVVEAGMVYPLRMRWARPVLDGLRKVWRGRSVSRVVFSFGNDGEVLNGGTGRGG